MTRTLVRVAGVVVLCATACGRDATSTRAPVPVRVHEVTMQDPRRDVRFAAEVLPRAHVTVAFEANGRVVEIAGATAAGSERQGSQPLDVGDRVTRGEPLAHLEAADYQDTLRAARARQAAAKAELRKAVSDLETVTQLYRTNSATRLERTQAVEAQAVALAQEREATADLERAQLAEQRTVLHSPLDGVVARRLVEVGSLVAAGTPAFVVADVSGLVARFGVPASFLPNLRIGQELTLRTPGGPLGGYPGHVVRIAPIANPTGRTFDVDLALDGGGDELRGGTVGMVAVPAGPAIAPGLVVPLDAVVGSDEGPARFAVFVVDDTREPTVVHHRPVTLGSLLVGDSVVVDRGLSGGERVVVRGRTRIRDGDPVRIVP